jgi:hypothetical protein
MINRISGAKQVRHAPEYEVPNSTHPQA